MEPGNKVFFRHTMSALLHSEKTARKWSLAGNEATIHVRARSGALPGSSRTPGPDGTSPPHAGRRRGDWRWGAAGL